MSDVCQDQNEWFDGIFPRALLLYRRMKGLIREIKQKGGGGRGGADDNNS